MQTDEHLQTYQLHESTPLEVVEMPTRAPVDSVPAWLWPRRRATMLEWPDIEFRILKLKLHSCIAYRVVGVGVGGWHGYPLLYAF
jgi:hypothetical protein